MEKKIKEKTGVNLAGMAASTWNNAGTWEEKDCTVWAKEALSSGLKAAATTSDPKAEVTEVHQVEGGLHFAFVRCQFHPPFCAKGNLHARSRELPYLLMWANRVSGSQLELLLAVEARAGGRACPAAPCHSHSQP